MSSKMLLVLSLSFIWLNSVYGLLPLQRCRFSGTYLRGIPDKAIDIEQHFATSDAKEAVTIEILSTELKEADSHIALERDLDVNAASIVAYDAVYDDRRAEKIESIYESPRGFFLTIFSNPWYLLLSFYMGAVAWNNKGNISRYFKGLFGMETEPPPVKNVEEMAFQVFECERCGMQMRPAKGRAEAVFSRPNFRCARCGAKASSFFNIDDKEDPRAIEREKRMKEEAEEDFEDDDVFDDD